MPIVSEWRRKARAVITGIIQQVGHQDLNELRRAISVAYPFGERRFHPYKIWVDEVRLQLAQFSPKSQRASRKKRKKRKKRGKGVDQISSNQPLPGQMTFELNGLTAATSVNAVYAIVQKLLVVPGVWEVWIRNADPACEWKSFVPIDTRSPEQIPVGQKRRKPSL